VRNRINKAIKQDGEWAGAPMPVSGHPLILEPRYPYQKLQGMTIGDLDPALEPETDYDRDRQEAAAKFRGWRRINRWRHAKYDGHVEVWRMPNGKSRALVLPDCSNRLKMSVSTMGTLGDAFSAHTEMRAWAKLQELLTDHQFTHYTLSGMFLERSERSGVTYLFRKLRPTVALCQDPDGEMRVLSCLCMHPIGYYGGTWAGALCPTDDVIAHLMMMRGDEPYFWRKANHHHPLEPEAGV
jgi:hypothetical protein